MMLCECCNKWLAVITDYRERRACIDKFYVCHRCMLMDNASFYRKLRQTERNIRT